MAAVGGVVHLTVLPNARTFHEKLKKEIEKKKTDYSVTIDPDLTKFHMELDKAEDRIDRMDGRVIDLYMRVHDDQAARAVDDFVRDAEAETIDKRMTVDTSEAQRVTDQFRDDQRDEGIKTFVEVDRFHADEEMDDFRKKQADKTILQKVALDFDSPAGRKDGSGPLLGGGSRKGRKKIMGIRGAVAFDRAPIDSVNFLPRMFRNMNAQLDLGLRQIYDSYFNLFSKVYDLTTGPYRRFVKMAREAKTLKEFFTGALAPAVNLAKKVGGLFKSIPAGLRKVRDGASHVVQVLKQTPTLLREFGKLAKEAWRHTRNLFSFFARPALTALSRARGAFVRIGHALSGTFVDAVNAARMQMSALAYGFTRAMRVMGSGPGMDKVLGFFDGLSHTATNSMAGIGRMTRNLGDSLATGMVGMTRRFMGNLLFDNFVAQFDGISRKLSDIGRSFSSFGFIIRKVIGNPFQVLQERASRAFKKISDITLGFQMGFTRIFRGVGRTISDTFGKAVYFVRNSFAGIQNAASRAFEKASRALKKISDVTLGFQMGFVRGFRQSFPTIIKMFGGLGRIISGTFTRVFGAIGNNRALYRALSIVMRRISTAFMGLSRVLMGTFTKMAGFMMKALVPALGAVLAGVMALGGQAAIGAVMALAGALHAVLMGAIVMMPAFLGAAAVGFGVLKMGLEGVGDAMGAALNTDSIEDFEEAIADAHPAVQRLARAMREFKDPIDDMKEAVQGNMLDGLDIGLRSAMNNLLPIFSEGAQKVATSWNRSFKNVLDELSSDSASSGLTAIMKGVEEMSIAMEPTLRNLVAAMGSLAEQGAVYLGPLGEWINGLSESIFNWAESLKVINPETGMSGFAEIMESAKTNAAYLGEIFGGLFGTLGNVLRASAEGGAGLLAGMAEGLRALEEATEKGTEGYASIVTFMENASAAASSLKQIMSPLLTSLMLVGAILADVATHAMPGLATALTGLKVGLEEMAPYASEFGESMGGVLEAFMPLLEALGATLGPILAGIAEGLNRAFDPFKLGGPFDEFFAKMVEMGPLIGDSFIIIGDTLGRIFEALAPILTSALGMIEPFLPLLDLFVIMLGSVVVALIEAVAPFLMLRDEAVAGLLDALRPLIVTIGNGLVGVINALAPLMPMLADLFVRIIEAITPIIPIVTKIAGEIFVALIDIINALMPVIEALIDWLGRMIDQYAQSLIPVLEWVLETFQRVWPIIVDVVKWAIDNVIVPLIKILSSVFEGLAKFIGWAIENVIVPVLNFLVDVFTKVVDTISWIIDNIAKPAIDGLKKAFEIAVDGIKAVWNGLKRIFAEPIKFFIQTVVNGGVIWAWNKVMGFLNQDDKKMGDIEVPSGLNFHQGGVLPGYSPGKDNHFFVNPATGQRIALAGGEGIMRQEFVSAVGGPRGIAKLNEDARHGRIEKHGRDSAAYAQGGVIGAMMNIVLQKYPMLTMTSGLRPGDSGYHGRGLATDWSNGSGNTPAQLALAHDIAATYPGSAQLIYASPGWAGNIYEGGPAGAMDSGIYKTAQAGRHDHHVHWAMTTAPTMPFGGGVFEGGSDGGGGGFFSQVTSWISDITSAFGGIKDKLLGLRDKFGHYAEMAVGFGQQAISASIDWAKSKLRALNPFGGSGSVDVSGITGPVVSQVEEVFAKHGFTGAEWEAAKWIIQRESNWDPTATNPSSGAFGLFQFNPMGGDTLGTYLPSRSTDPAVQADAGARYMKDRYGTPSAAKAFWERNNWYDQGGIANGIGVMQKNVLAPERVLSPAQTKAFNEFVYNFMPQLIREFKDRPFELRRHFGVLTEEIARIHKELRDGNIARLTATMKDEFKRRAAGENLADNPIDFNFDSGWFDRNGQKVMDNLTVASRRMADAIVDPDAYLEAEARARKELEEEFEAAKKKADEEAREAKAEADRAEDEARREKEKAEDEAAETEEEKEALKKQREEEAKARKEAADAEAEASRAREEEEQARIEAAKADGSFYYGYKTFDAEGGNPNASEMSREETAFRSFLDSFGDRTGLSPAISGVAKRFDVLRSIGEAAQTAAPAWIAALNGDPSGLAYNVAVGTAQVRKQAITEAEGLAPQALAGIMEMAVSRGNANNAPFIGEVNSGMTQAELMQTLEYYEGMRARRGTGTTRVR